MSTSYGYSYTLDAMMRRHNYKIIAFVTFELISVISLSN